MSIHLETGPTSGQPPPGADLRARSSGPHVALLVLVPVLFLEALPALNSLGKLGGLVLLLFCLMELRHDPRQGRALVRHGTPAFGLLLLLLAWLTLTVLWAEDAGRATAELLRWVAVGALFLVVALNVRDLVALRRFMGAFCLGGALSTVVSLSGAGDASVPDDRLGSAAGDPNFLGAWLLAALLLALALLASTGGAARRSLLTGGVVLIGVGLLLTLSRGALVAGAGTAVAAVLLLERRRRAVLATLALLLLGAGAWLRSSEQAWQRLTTPEGGSGRTDLWTVAWRMARDNPLTGVGIDNFPVEAAESMGRVRPLRSSYLIGKQEPEQVHNAYLQILAEGGLPALGLLLVFAGCCVAATVRAARRLDVRGEHRHAISAYGVVLAQCGLLCASVFLPSLVDKRLWLLLALGPALAVATRERPEVEP